MSREDQSAAEKCGYQGFGSGNHPTGPGCVLDKGHDGPCSTAASRCLRVPPMPCPDPWCREHGVCIEQRRSSTAAQEREWVVLRARVETQYFKGVRASTAEQAIQDWIYYGAGELSETTVSEWQVDAEEADCAA